MTKLSLSLLDFISRPEIATPDPYFIEKSPNRKSSVNARSPDSDDDAAGLTFLHRQGGHPSAAFLIVCVSASVCLARACESVYIVREVPSPLLFLEAGDPSGAAAAAAAQQTSGGGEGR